MTAASLGSLMLNSMPIRGMANGEMMNMLHNSQLAAEGRILVMVQLHGGNDGINTFVPLDQFSDYTSLRSLTAMPDPNMSISGGSRSTIQLDANLPSEKQIGLHPDLAQLKVLWDMEKVAIIQSVGYDNLNQSHFRSRDIWFMGGGFSDYFSSGWMGRFLDTTFPNYPDNYPNAFMLDPLGLELGTRVSLGFHRGNGLPAAIAVDNPEDFNELVSGVGGLPPDTIPNDRFGSELEYLIGIERSSNKYATRLEEVFLAGSNTVAYPATYTGTAVIPVNKVNNSLSPQLQTVARLISGGCQTRIYLVRLGGFDTHSLQVDVNDTTGGTHAALMNHLAEALKAFQDDLANQGLEDRVLTVTFSEFGRRPYDNGSYGTDHGKAAPMIVIGKGVNPVVVGDNPSLTNFDSSGNLLFETDYRQVFTDILRDWMGADIGTLESTTFGDYADQTLNIIHQKYSLGMGDACPCHD